MRQVASNMVSQVDPIRKEEMEKERERKKKKK